MGVVPDRGGVEATGAPATFARPPAADIGLLAVAVAAVSTSGPLVVAIAAPALAIAFWRNAMGSAVILPWALVRRWRELRTLDRRSWRLSTTAGVLLAVHFGTWIPSLALTSVASSTALVATQPVWAAAFARAGGRTVPRTVWVGIGLAVLGTALLAGVDVHLSGKALAGDLLALVGGAFGAGYVTVGAKVRSGVSTASYTAICYSVCAVLLLVVNLAAGTRLVGYDGETWLKLVALTVAAQLLGHSLVNVVLRTTSATVVSLAILVEVPGASLIAALWLHQVPPATAIPGLALLVAGAAVVIRAGSRLVRGDPTM